MNTFDARRLISQCSNWNDFESILGELSNQEKGRAFEDLVKLYLSTDPTFSSKIVKIWHHSEIPLDVIRILELPQPEIGVDLVARVNDGSYWAIQCKYHHDKDSNVSYQEISTFLSITERDNTFRNLSHRLLCTSANGVSDRVVRSHSNRLGYLTSGSFTELQDAQFERFRKYTEGKILPIQPRHPRTHQTEAVQHSIKYFAESSHRRGKIIHPCGAGKSLTGYWLADSLNARLVLIAVPSLSLVKQTLGTWTQEAMANNISIDWIAVCSDESTGEIDNANSHTADIGIEVDTDVELIARFLTQETKGVRAAITTYQSGKALAEAARRSNTVFDLGIFDEAHKTVGRKDKSFAHLLFDTNVEIGKRVFMTATEREFKGDTDKITTMDDKSVYGQLIHYMSFKQAIEEKPPILSDYKVVTTLMPDSYITSFIERQREIRGISGAWTIEGDGSAIAAFIALGKLINEKGARRAISFHSNIARAKDFKTLADQMSSASGIIDGLSTFHVSSKDSIGRRVKILKNFMEKEISLITNARCLVEGIDIPSVDTVLFADPKQSKIDIVQAAGRAMRNHPSKEIGYILLPIVLSSTSENQVRSAFNQIIAVLAALGMHDERIVDEFRDIASRKSRGGKIVEINSVGEGIEDIDMTKLIREIDILVWDRLSFAKSTIGESMFTQWMRECTQLSEKSITNYTQAVRKISNDLVRLGITGSTLEEIVSSADLARLQKQYFGMQEFKDQDSRGKGMYSAGFAKLIEYQKSRRC